MWRDEQADPPTLVCQVGSTKLGYQLRCIDDLHGMLRERGDWMDLGAADEQKSAKDGTVEAWARSPDNPVGGWYGIKKGLRGRFGMYVPARSVGAREARAQRPEQPDASALGTCRDPHAHLRTATVRRDRFDRSAVRFDQPLGDRQPQPGTARVV